jgi:4-hydroxy-3-methylbut-2-enyl diphosphate reductase
VRSLTSPGQRRLPSTPPAPRGRVIDEAREAPRPAERTTHQPDEPGTASTHANGRHIDVLAALRVEARRVPGARPVGMGPRAARRAGEQLARQRGPRAPLAVVGLGGSLDPRLRPGTLFVATSVATSDGRFERRLPSALLLASALRRAGASVMAGPLISARAPALGARRARIAKRFGANAVDLESGWLLRALPEGDRPVCVVRAVSDAPRATVHEDPLAASEALAAAAPPEMAVAPDMLRYTPHTPASADEPAAGGGGRRGLQLGPLAGVRAGLRALEQLRGALDAWARAAGARTVRLAAPRSFCAGVVRAIETVERALEQLGPPVYVRRQIVHNAHVVRRLERMGAVFVEELDEVPDGATVVLAAHGVAPEVRRRAAARRELTVIDATCPLVAKVHAEARRFAAQGYEIVLVGHSGHEEVEGTMGEAPGRIHLVERADDVEHLELEPGRPVAYLTQTTLAVDETAEVVEALRARFGELAGPPTDDICYATQNRQDAVRALARVADLVLVIGSPNSSNTARLVEVAEREGTRAELIEDASAVDLAWLEHAQRIGVTAGASAPEALVEELVDELRGLGPVDVEEVSVGSEDVRFALPAQVRRAPSAERDHARIPDTEAR